MLYLSKGSSVSPEAVVELKRIVVCDSSIGLNGADVI
jgi:hypothetical protein